jgi:hypothetical protein
MTVETAVSPPKPRQRRIARWYVGAAIMLFNTLLVFVLLNLALWPILSIHRSRARPSYLKYPDDWYRKVYPGLADSDWKEMVKESKDRPFEFGPYVMFTEPPYQGRYVNVSEQGYRLVPNQGPWPMDPKNYNVMTFGGSTMFGYAVSDEQTVPAYLQTILQNSGGRRVCVYNFGRRAYFSTQERILFEQLLRDGARPNLVVFMDGLNDFLFAEEPTFIQQSQDELLAPVGGGTRFLEIWQSLPAGQAAQILSQKLVPPPKSPPPADWSKVDPVAIDRYVWNKKAIESISASMGIETVFVFQPTPIYKYVLTDAILSESDFTDTGDECVIHGYPLMAQYVKDHSMGDDFLWLADIQQGASKRLYVDKWHYSPEFSKEIAGDIWGFLKQRKKMPGGEPSHSF